jgi:hypothetical protein
MVNASQSPEMQWSENTPFTSGQGIQNVTRFSAESCGLGKKLKKVQKKVDMLG